jgi:hypothetical protein
MGRSHLDRHMRATNRGRVRPNPRTIQRLCNSPPSCSPPGKLNDHLQNPSQAAGCNLTVGNSYCIEENWSIPAPTPTTTSSASPTPTAPTTDPATLLAICEAHGSYKEYCPRCLYRCAEETTYIDQCFQSVFMYIEKYDSECWQHGGHNCENQAVDRVCSKTQ